MAPRAIRRWIQMFLGDDLTPDLSRIAIGNPVELRHQLRWTNVWRRIAVALQTKRHVERLLLMHFDHLIDASVAAHAANSRGDVSLMIEKYEVWKLVNLDPRDRLPGR